MSALRAIGLLAIIALIIYLIYRKSETDEQRADYLGKLLVGNYSLEKEFEVFYRDHKGWSYDAALRKFFEDPVRLQNAEQVKKNNDQERHIIKEQIKKEYTINRVFAYDYESFLYSLYSPLAEYYDYIKQWRVSFNARFPKSYICYKMELEGFEDVNGLFQAFCDKDLLFKGKDESGYTLGSTLTKYANVVSDQDTNIDKWIKEHGQSMTKEELVEDERRVMSILLKQKKKIAEQKIKASKKIV